MNEDSESIVNEENTDDSDEEKLPEKSQTVYLKAYNDFMQWKRKNGKDSFSEKVVLQYFKEIANNFKTVSLVSRFSMLKSTLKIHQNVDIYRYKKVSSFLAKLQTQRFDEEKSEAKSLTLQEMYQFIAEAPDFDYLAMKVVLIFWISSSSNLRDLSSITINDIENHGNYYAIKKPFPKKNEPEVFTVEGEFHKLVARYASLRPEYVSDRKFFLRYSKGKCSNIVLGKNAIARIPKQIAKFLELPDPELYTCRTVKRFYESLHNTGIDMSNFGPKIEEVNVEPWKNLDPVNQIKQEEEEMEIDDLVNDTQNEEKSQPKIIQVPDGDNVIIKFINCTNCTITVKRQ